MAITRFDDIPNLYIYVSGVESNIVKSGNDVTSIDNPAGYTLDANQWVQKDSVLIQHDGVTAVGSCPAFIGLDAGNNSGLECNPLVNPPDNSTGLTIAVLEERFSTAGDYSWGFNAASTTPRTAMRVNSAEYAYLMAGASRSTGQTALTGPQVLSMRWDDTPDSTDFYIGQTAYSLTHSSADPVVDKAYLMNRMDSSSASMRGKMAIFVMYKRRLDDTEMTDLITLMEYWRDNGEAPGGAPPTTVTFGPVTTNDDPSVTSWSWEASEDGGSNWDEAENVLSDVSGEATTSLVVNSATAAEDQTQVRCRAYSANEPGGVVSGVATLTVQAAS
jgi:hypothetical protein